MKHSTDRILVTHEGTLPRAAQLRDKVAAKEENVIAGTDCGIGSRVGHGEVAWAKLNALAEGARIASRSLWGR